MRVLGIDPGSRVAGYGLVELLSRTRQPAKRTLVKNQVSPRHRPAGLGYLDAGTIVLGDSRVAVGRRLLKLGLAVSQLIEEWRPDLLAVEEAFFGKSVQSALRIGEARGVVLYCAERAGLRTTQFAPARIKKSVAGSGRASKESLARMIQLELGCPISGLGADATDALALALCALRHEERLELLAASAKRQGKAELR